MLVIVDLLEITVRKVINDKPTNQCLSVPFNPRLSLI